LNKHSGRIEDHSTHAELGLALDRANAVLSTLAACYDGKTSRFVVNDEFVVQAIASIEVFVGQAKKSLEALNVASTHTVIANELPMPSERFEIGFADELVAPSYEPASSYDELMRKITAAEVFAAEGQNNLQSPANAALVPLLKSLRHDLQKIRAA
jgi:hypothetical protein